MEDQRAAQKSFCVPRAAIDALLSCGANTYEIFTYLTLANYTDASGVYSTASVKAVNTATGANKMRGGPVHRALERLTQMHAFKAEMVPNGKISRKTDLGPILVDRVTWIRRTGEILPDGPTERGQVRYILPDFDEQLIDRVWFGSGLVEGFGRHEKPLKAVKNAGDVAARVMLKMYAACDMELWGGVRPIGDVSGPCQRYEPVNENAQLRGGAVLVRAKRHGPIAVVSGDEPAAYWQALRALESIGLFYEVVMVLNRDAVPATFKGGEKYGRIPADAEPLYELDCRSQHGYKPKGEEGLGGITAKTAGELGCPVTSTGNGFSPEDGTYERDVDAAGMFDGTYAGIVRRGQGAMIVGIYRPRYRASNSKNAGVKGTWARIHQNNREAYAFISSIRAANGLQPMLAPWEAAEKARESKRKALPTTTPVPASMQHAEPWEEVT